VPAICTGLVWAAFQGKTRSLHDRTIQLSTSYFETVNKYLSGASLLNPWGYYNYLGLMALISPAFSGNNSFALRGAGSHQ
jgi:hypothetical protein